MSKHRYVGGIISATQPTPSQASASGVWTLDEAQYYQRAGQWPPGSGADPYFQNTTLLLHGDGTNGAQNNTFVDSSANNFTITRTGNTTQGSFNPYVGPGNWSVFFDGSGDYLQLPNLSVYNIGSGNFTVECWIYPTTLGAYNPIFKNFVGSNANYEIRLVNGKMCPVWGDTVYTGTTTLVANTWYHIAMVRNGNTLLGYVNGVLDSSNAITGSQSTSNYRIGADQSAVNFYSGYISNFRQVIGQAVYTAAFTVPTTPLIATTQTVLLTCNNNGFNDISGANALITRNGDTRTSKFAPFTFYQTNPASYSGYFDGTGDYLSMAASPSTALGAGDFTVEYWAFYNTFASSPIGFDSRSSSGDITPSDYVTTGGNLVFYYNSANLLTSTNAAVLGRWNHIAWVRAGNILTSYINGVASGSVVSSANFGNSQPFRIAGNITTANFLNGSVSNFRVVKGTAVYTANFTPSVAALTSTTTVSSSASNSVSFDGTGDYLSVASNAAFGFGTGDFTVEYWIYATSWASTPTIVDLRAAAGTSGFSDYYSAGGAPNMYWHNTTILTSSLTVPVNTWTHVAYTRASGAVNIFVNGALGASGTSTSDLQASVPCRIGATFTPNNFLTGAVSNLRITKGQALYTAAFTPSTTPLTTTSQGATAANVSLLTCQDRLLEDNSNNLFAVTPTGDARPTSLNPFVSTNGIGGTSYSGYFDGTGDYLTLPAPAATTIGTSSFTWEAWLFPTAVGTFSVIYDTNAGGDTTGTGRFLILLETSGQVKLSTLAGTSVLLASTVNLTSNRWVHVAITRSGTSGYMFFNGVQVATGTFSTNFLVATAGGTNRPIIGANGYNGSNGFSGNISNLRLIIGTALYTAGFSPSTTPLTAVTNTQLLTCQSTTFIDNSANAITITAAGNAVTDEFNPFSGATTLLTCQSTQFIDNSAIPLTITANGNATPKRANPFTDTVTGPTAYTGSTYSGSAYFDGSGDYLTLTGSSNLAFGSNNFTIEAWIYPTVAADRMIYDGRPNSVLSGPYPTLYIGATNQVLYYTSGANRILGGTIQYYAWNHIALVRSSGTTRLYLNGALIGSYVDATNYVNGTARPIIGADGSNVATLNMLGYLSNLRVVNGTAVYTGPFVPPTAPVTAVSGTQLLVNGTNAGIFDNTTVNDLETIGSAQVSTSVVKYGTGSMSFNGLSDALIMPSQPAIAFNTGDFTVEGWVYFAGAPASTFHSLYSTLVQLASPGDHGVLIRASTTKLIAILQADNATTLTLTSTNNVTTGQWYHFALTRSGTTARLFLNGTLEASGTSSVNFYETAQALGRVYATSTGTTQYLNGYLDDVRVTKGVARYTANFTPPAAAFPNF